MGLAPRERASKEMNNGISKRLHVVAAGRRAVKMTVDAGVNGRSA